MNFINKEIEEYAISKSTTPSSLCDEIEKITKEESALHRMMIGKLEASFLGFLIKSLNVEKVLEIGTFTGYSAQAMAEALGEEGTVTTIDKNKKLAALAQRMWDKGGHGKKITSLTGDALEVLSRLSDKYDLIFIDADKRNYKNYLDKCLDLVSDKGVIVIDNVLWSGRVIDEKDDEKSTPFIREVNDYIQSREDLHGTLLPIRDGIFLIKKNS